ncbi:Oidioi.mRNA.OKI2018_I69.PAR.g12738.t1.cds [Oikopleura dioica]|uniref:Oidioi.mRNA.OKI2018_I69.PAR.g12738.t1.cds n=1 Tax=Oikopleura dioica TaxID=34765 RepID=A0ABN7S5D8_OIKDI|nr:Oidioi.mRNA.OKI2018_I69.PAR.g12738.t1.cds [Oikopleura dioica]
MIKELEEFVSRRDHFPKPDLDIVTKLSENIFQALINSPEEFTSENKLTGNLNKIFDDLFRKSLDYPVTIRNFIRPAPDKTMEFVGSIEDCGNFTFKLKNVCTQFTIQNM